MSLLSRLVKKSNKNKFNQAFISRWGVETPNYDINNDTYLEKGYNYNSIVYSIVSKQATKTSSIPYQIKKVKDENSRKILQDFVKSTKYNFTPLQQVKYNKLFNKAYSEEYLNMPLEKPNATQSWREFHQLYKIFLKNTGNVFIYEVKPQGGINSGVPKGIYILPSQYMQIIVRKDANMLNPLENPIDYYRLLYGDISIKFQAEDVYHINYSNPNYDQSGEHLYGLSPMRALLRNIQSSNSATDSNIKTLLNNGAFGFIYGKNVVLNEDQVKGIKDRLNEMDNDPKRLGKLSALSAEIGFQRISLTTDELKPFEYLQYDQKQICNALNYSDKLLNNDDGAKYDNVNQFRKQILTDDIKPDLMLLEEGFWYQFLKKFEGYENTVLCYDISELPEMQEDTEKLVKWSVNLLDRGVINRNEARELINFSKVEDENMEQFTVNNDLLTLEEAVDSSFNVDGE